MNQGDTKADGELGEQPEGAAKPAAKELKLSANMYTVSYCAFMKKNKEKFRLKSEDQNDIFYRALFMLMI